MLARIAHWRAQFALILMATAMPVLSGCADTSHRPHTLAADLSAHEALVLPPTAMLDFEHDAVLSRMGIPWEYGRNDAAINFRPYGAAMPYGWSDTYTSDRFHTFGGRIHDHSRYEVRSYRIR